MGATIGIHGIVWFSPADNAANAKSGTYPLLVVIHGGNQSIVRAMDTWDPEVIGDDLIIAYVQSSLRADTKSYRWDLGGVDIYHLPTAQDEVLGLYQAIVREYAVDTDRVALAGFSQGGSGRWIEPVRIRTADAR